MCSAKEFFETRSEEDLSEFLIDAFDRHSRPEDIKLSEMAHIERVKDAVALEFNHHPVNKTLSHEMWAVAAVIAQFNKASDPSANMPVLLGPKVYNNPAFSQAFRDLRDLMRAQPQLMRA